jgi:hypothetical protein
VSKSSQRGTGAAMAIQIFSPPGRTREGFPPALDFWSAFAEPLPLNVATVATSPELIHHGLPLELLQNRFWPPLAAELGSVCSIDYACATAHD